MGRLADWVRGIDRSGPRPTLSVCTITLDRAEELSGMLENVAEVADEVVVLDGGSSDGTAAVVARFPKARLQVHPWDGSFSRQKNRCYAAARGDWILNLDTDERLGKRLKAALPDLLRSKRHDLYRVPMYWLSSADPPRYIASRPHYPCAIPRLFRNRPEFRYVEDPECHTKFPRELVRRAKKLEGVHLFHYCFVFNDRAAIEARLRGYERYDPTSARTNGKYYRTWDVPHEVRPCEEEV